MADLDIDYELNKYNKESCKMINHLNKISDYIHETNSFYNEKIFTLENSIKSIKNLNMNKHNTLTAKID